MAKNANTSQELARKVASALLAMPEESKAALASESAGWTIPLNYQPVHDALKDLRIGPYKDYGKLTLEGLMLHYWKELVIIIILFIGILGVASYVLHLNRVLRLRGQEIEELNSTLEQKVKDRTGRIQGLLKQESYLRRILQTVAEVNELLITSQNKEALLGSSFEKLASHPFYGLCWIGVLKEGVISDIYRSSDMWGLTPRVPISQDAPVNVCPIAKSLKEGRVLIVNSIQTELAEWEMQDVALKAGFKNLAALPLSYDRDRESIGVLVVYGSLKDGFSDEEVAMLGELAGDIGFALHAFLQREAVEKLENERTVNYEETILSFVNMIEHRDTYTAGHTLRVANYCEMIAQKMGLEPETIRVLNKAAILHDIGKIATPDAVLLKPGQLSSMEYDLIKQHAYAGYEMLSKIKMYEELADVIRHHHERYDGLGYPDGLKGDNIPLLSRIMAVADTFDAMTTNRIYKPRKEVEEAIVELKSLSGAQFDPYIVKVASEVLKNVTVAISVSQLPRSELERRRFAYFFNDAQSGAYNGDYLQIVLLNNKDAKEYTGLNIILIDATESESERVIVERIVHLYPNSLLFRVAERCFALLSHDFADVASAKLSISCTVTSLDLTKEPITYQELKKRFCNA